jgi:hypothetical protein
LARLFRGKNKALLLGSNLVERKETVPYLFLNWKTEIQNDSPDGTKETKPTLRVFGLFSI